MRIEIADYCIRCGICQTLYPELFKRNSEEKCFDVLFDEIPEELQEKAQKAAQDCAVAAIRVK